MLECRHSLEASLYHMTLQLMCAAGSQLQMPGLYLRHDWCDQFGLDLKNPNTKKFLEKTDWVIEPEQTGPNETFTSSNKSIHDSSWSAPDLVSADGSIEIHLLSYRKRWDDRPQIPPSTTKRIVAINLNAYARSWWETCDPELSARIDRVGTNKKQLARWLSTNRYSYRGFLHHPDSELLRAKFEEWARKRRAEDKAKEDEWNRLRRAEQRARSIQIDEASGHWIFPPDSHAKWLYAAASSNVGSYMQDKERQHYGLQHLGGGRYGWIGKPGDKVPWEVRKFLKQPLVPQELPPEVEIDEDGIVQDPSKQPKMISPGVPEAEVILEKNVRSCCICGAPVDRVIIGPGEAIAGRKAERCSANKNHPTTML